MSRQHGFTLIETILTISITAVVLAAVFSALRLGIASWERGESMVERSALKRNVLYRLEREMASAYPFMIKDTEAKVAFVGRNNAVGFVTVAPAVSSIYGPRWVSYAAGDEGLTVKEDFLTSEKILTPDGGYLVEKEPEIKGIDFKYLGKGGWSSSWEPERNELPRALKADVLLRNEDRLSLIIPLGAGLAGQESNGPG